MVKILVADDNSNIQKMVGLALKDQGIEVVAVGNGEAAVRKIADVNPDLVLADVFMPVRSGYEVCQFVKKDPKLAHIPVILLVGAFDPLDEQEAQRVGADGVLKKPFVPPDPLISMVKSALARAGVTAEKQATPPPPKINEAAPPLPAGIGSSGFGGSTAMELSAEFAEQSFVEEVPLRPAVAQFSAAENTAAFGSLLETPGAEEQDEAAYVAPANSPIPERDWRSGEEQEAEEGGEESSTSWRRDGTEETVASADHGASARPQDWRDAALADENNRAKTQRGWTPTHEKTELVEAAESLPAVSNPPSNAPWSTSKSAATAEQVATAVEDVKPSEFPFVPPAAAAPSHKEDEAVPSAYAPASTEPVEAAAPAPSEWLSVPASPWDTEASKANQLASTWDAPIAAIPAIHHEAGSPEETNVSPEDTVTLPAETVEAIQGEVSHVAEVSEPQQSEPAAPEAEAPAAAPDMEAMVAKVLSKLNPEVLQAVTREILKPVIESIVRDEITSKK